MSSQSERTEAFRTCRSSVCSKSTRARYKISLKINVHEKCTPRYVVLCLEKASFLCLLVPNSAVEQTEYSKSKSSFVLLLYANKHQAFRKHRHTTVSTNINTLSWLVCSRGGDVTVRSPSPGCACPLLAKHQKYVKTLHFAHSTLNL